MKSILTCPNCGAQFCPFCGIGLSACPSSGGPQAGPAESRERHAVQQHPVGLPAAQGDWQQFNYEMRQETPVLVREIKRPRRKQPARPASVESDVKVPLHQAVVSGCGIGLIAICIVTLCAVELEWPWWIVPLATIGATVLGMVAAWFLLLVDHRKLLWLVEDLVGVDLDGDGEKGEPEKPTVRIEVTDRRTELEEGEQQKDWQAGDMPVSLDTLRNIAIAVFQQGCSFSRSALTEAGVISDGDCRKLHETMREAGWARYVDGKPNLGTELTAKGQAVLRGFLPPSPTMFRGLEFPTP